MPKRSSTGGKDANTLGKSTVDQATGEAPESADDGKNPAAVALGRLGGLKGGQARAESLSPKQRAEIARNAAKARWSQRRSKG